MKKCIKCKNEYLRKDWFLFKHTCPECFLNYIKTKDSFLDVHEAKCYGCGSTFETILPYDTSIFCSVCINQDMQEALDNGEEFPLCPICGQPAFEDSKYCVNCDDYAEYLRNLKKPRSKEYQDFAKAKASVPPLVKEWIKQRDNHTCYFSDSHPERDHTSRLCIDHIIPYMTDSKFDVYNYMVLCESCNTRKGNNILPESNSILLDIELRTNRFIAESKYIPNKIRKYLERCDKYSDFLLSMTPEELKDMKSSHLLPKRLLGVSNIEIK